MNCDMGIASVCHSDVEQRKIKVSEVSSTADEERPVSELSVIAL